MLVSLLVYLSLMGLMILFARPSYMKPINGNGFNNPFLYCFWSSLLFAFVFGIRFNVGIDHLNYIESYLYGRNRTIERGYDLLEGLFSNAGLHYAWFFGFIAFLQISFFTAGFKDRKIYPWLVIAIFLGCRWFSWCNGIRQAIACCLFVFSLQFIEEKKPLFYVLLILLAGAFHRSAIFLLLPCYFIGRLDFFKKKWVPWVVFGIALLIQRTDFASDFLSRVFDSFSVFLGYDEIYTADEALHATVARGGSTGLGRLATTAASALILAMMPSLRRQFGSYWFTILSNLFLIGLFGSTAFNKIVILTRPFLYFSQFRTIIIAYLLYYLFSVRKNSNNVLIGWLMIGLVSVTFIATIYYGESNTAAYHVFWEFQ